MSQSPRRENFWTVTTDSAWRAVALYFEPVQRVCQWWFRKWTCNKW